MKKTIKYLQDGEYHYATVKDVGDLEQLRTKHKEDLVTALNELFTTGGNAKPTGYDDLVKKVNDTQTTVNGINNTITDINGKVVANDEAIAQAKKGLQDALTQFQTFNDEIEQAKKDAETKLANAKQALKDEFNANLADAQKANQKQLEDKVAVIQGNLDTTSNTLNDVKTQLANAKLDYGNVNVSIQKLNDMLSTKLSSTDLDPLRTSIQNQETEIQQTKDSIATKAGKAELDVLSGRVSNTEAKIKQQADEISLGVKKSELNGAIDNYQIEGTNRLRNTIDFDIDGGYWKLDRYSINLNTDVHPYDQAHDVLALVLQKTGSAKQDVDFTNEDLGQSFVVSMWNKKDAQPQVWYGNTQLTNRQVAEIKGDYERSFFTFIPTNVNVKTIMFKYDAGTVDQLVIGEPKLELGTKPKAYAPNPNDEHKQIVNTKAELKIASDKIESTVEKQTKTDNNVNQLSSRVTQTEQGITAANDLITKTKDGLIKDYTGKINASAKSLSSEFDEKTNEKIGQITDSGENLILNSAFTNEADRKDKWQNISDKVNIVADNNGLMWAHMSQTGLTADNPISLTSNYFPIKQGKITVGVDIKSDNTSGLSGAKILVLQTYNANKQRVDFTELSLENMGLTISQLADGQSHRGVYRLGNDRSDAVYMTVKAVLPRNGSMYFTNFSAKLSSIDNGGYTPNAEDLKRQILNQKTKIEQNSQQITLKASSTELRDVQTIANGAVSSASDANSKISSIQANGGGVNLLRGTRDFSGDWLNLGTNFTKTGDTYNGLSVVETTGDWAGISQYYQVKKGETYTFSLFARYTSGTGTSSIYILLNSNPESGHQQAQLNNWSGAYALDTNWKKCSITFTATTDGYIKSRMERTSTNANTLQVCGYMLEKGTVAHEWQPAPEDIQTQIDQARTDIQSTLTVANNGITAATNLKTTYDNYVQKNDANIKLLGDRITNEVSKITSNGGGRNLLVGSDPTLSNRPSFGGVTEANIDGVKAWESNNTDNIMFNNISLEANTTYTYSALIKADTAGGLGFTSYGHFQVKNPNAHNQADSTHEDIPSERDYHGINVPANQWTKIYYTFTTNDLANSSFGVFPSHANGHVYIRHLMLEKGTIAHDWQPAPEDTQSQIEAVSSKIDQTATSITSTVNSTKQDLQGQINSANTKITQTADSITEQLKSYSKTGDMQNYVNTTIQKTADGINTKVSGMETSLANANSKLDGITSNGGGRNLWIDSKSFQHTITNTPKVDFNTDSDGITTAHITGTGGFYGQWQNIYANSTEPFAISDSETFSVEMKGTGTITIGREHDFEKAVTLTDTWTRYAVSGTVNSTNRAHIIYNESGKDCDAYVRLPMVEKGTVVHDWQPAPEDTNSAIETAKTDLVQQITDAKNAAIKVSKDSINSEVSDVRTTITQVNNKIDNIKANGGGRNLLQGTGTASGDVANGGVGNHIIKGAFNGYDAIKTNTAFDERYINLKSALGRTNAKAGDWFTVSVYVKADKQINTGSLNIYRVLGNGDATTNDGYLASIWMLNKPITTEWQQYAWSFQINDISLQRQNTRIEYNCDTGDNWIYWAGWMLEKGTVAHDWQPSPQDVATDISNVNTKVEQYKTGINQTATGMNLFAQVITGNKSIDVTKSNIGIDPNQIKIASNRIVIDGNTSINGTLKVPNVKLQGNGGSIDLSGDAINIKNNNSTYGLILKSDGVAVGDKDKFYGLFTSASLDFFMKTQNAPRPYSLGAIEESHLVRNPDVHGISITGKPYKDNKGDNYQGGNYIDFGFENPDNTPSNPMIRLVWRDLNNVNNGTVRKGIHVCDNIYVDQSATCIFPPGTQDPLMITGLKFSNSTQSDFFQPTLQAGWSNSLKGDSGLTFFWNSVRAFGTLDLTGTQIRMADAEANLEFGWTSWNDWPGKIPSLFRRNGNNTGGIAIGSDSNVILFGNGHRWNLNERGGY